MERLNSLPVRGARVRRLFTRLGVYYALMVFYLLCCSTRDENGLVVWCCVAVPTVVILFFALRKRWQRMREIQVSSEVLRHYPFESRETLQMACTERRRRDLRFDAMTYLGFAAETALCIWMLYLADGWPLYVRVGIFGLTGFLLLQALGLLLVSWFAPVRDKTPTIDEYLADAAWQRIDTGESKAPDRRGEGYTIAVQAETEPGFTTIDRLIQKQVTVTPRRKDNVAFEIGFFALLVAFPVLGFLITLPLLITPVGVLPLCFFLVGVICFPIFVFIFRREIRDHRVTERKRLLQSGQFAIRPDRILSILRSEKEAYTTEVVLEHAGTVKVQGAPLQEMLLAEQPERAQLLYCGPELLGIVFFAHDVAAGSEADIINKDARYALPPEAAEWGLAEPLEFQDGFVYSDEQVRTEALRRLAVMDFDERKMVVDEVYRANALGQRLHEKGHSKRTKAEQGELQALFSSHLNRVRGMGYEQLGMEAQLTEAGLTREEIANMKQNPYLRGFLFLLGIAVSIVAISAALSAIIGRFISKDLSALVGFSALGSGMLAVKSTDAFMGVFKFRNLQKTYRKAETWEKITNAEMYHVLYRHVEDRIRREKETE